MNRIVACVFAIVFGAVTPVTAEQLESSNPEAGQDTQLGCIPITCVTLCPVRGLAAIVK